MIRLLARDFDLTKQFVLKINVLPSNGHLTVLTLGSVSPKCIQRDGNGSWTKRFNVCSANTFTCSPLRRGQINRGSGGNEEEVEVLPSG